MRIAILIALVFVIAAPALAKGGKGKDPSNVSAYWCAGHSASPLCKH